MGKFLILFFLVITLQSAYSSDESFEKLFERKSIPCEINGIKWTLSLRARTQKVDPKIDEDNLGFSHLYLVGKSTHLVAQIPAPPYDVYASGQFSFTKVQGLCSGTTSFLLNPAVVAIIFNQTPITGPTIPHILFYDFEKDLILDREIGLGRSDVKLDQVFGNGILSTPRVDRSEAARDFPIILHGKKFVWEDNDLHAIRITQLKAGKVETNYHLDLSWKLSPWGRFFNSLKSFLIATSWNEAKKEFNNNFVVYARAIDEECLLLFPHAFYPKSTELSKQKGWICKKFSSSI
ncbi:MAG: hypothetical protein A2381_03780 [Bdellovibrionales bacterium RIFOXYB1_FULL_37_110]|nr:MAG: hypothetical protein A2417_16375 [Bdellovibrionales bacterium RIFOXYC1_FULL_37_79]OFZ59156.1 MAG: hypothetical protein A2381_03780 [Bdellovibrionales bacterium RIFOXYB1_FULL_37_110]OFZ64161.1 MAG: hypothetical protein A2577_14810 [Bdellovibrionales bacterium RIFOXYD1_FULL_36_51]